MTDFKPPVWLAAAVVSALVVGAGVVAVAPGPTTSSLEPCVHYRIVNHHEVPCAPVPPKDCVHYFIYNHHRVPCSAPAPPPPPPPYVQPGEITTPVTTEPEAVPVPSGGPPSSSCEWRSGHGCPAVPAPCHSIAGGLEPDPRCTPGALNPEVSQATLNKTICVVGWTSTVRPPVSYTAPLKEASMAAYGDGTNTSLYEFDHFIPLELGGAPADIRNLWPEPHPSSFQKDNVENLLKARVCAGQLTLAQGQREIYLWQTVH
jgi:hypothetical protein